MVCDSYEGVDIARYFNGHGISAFVLRYRVGKWARHPAPLQDIERAMRMVRARAVEYGIDPSRIGVLGFSAGGHLVATIGTHFSPGNSKAADAPPFFLVHTNADQVVNAENSAEMYLGLRRKNIPAELHIFEKGPHGLGLGGGSKGDPGTRGMYQWPQLCVHWLRERGLLE